MEVILQMANKRNERAKYNRGSKGQARKRKDADQAAKNKNAKDSQNNMELDSSGRDNDPNWYFTNADIADQVSTFSFNQFIGMDTQFPVVSTATTAAGVELATGYIPSILSIECNASPGNCDTQRTGINQAALKIYTTLSSRNAKTALYAPQDVSMLILAIGDLVSVLEHVRRAFGVAYTYNQRNRALPRKLLQVMGFDPDDFLANLADYRNQFNSWITGLNRLSVPVNIAYIDKCYQMYQRVYLDSESSMAQIILMRPRSYWTLNETLSDTGTVLHTEELPLYTSDTALNRSWQDWSDAVMGMIEALNNSSTLNYIYADVLMLHDKYGMPLLQLGYLASDYMVVPEYNRNFMLQVHNLTPINQPYTTMPDSAAQGSYTLGNDVYQDVDNNKLKYNPIFPMKANTNILDVAIIDMDTPEATVVDRIEATRYIAIPTLIQLKGNTTTTTVARYSALPDHYVVNVRVIMGAGNAGAGVNEGIKGHTFNFVQSSINLDDFPNIFALTQVDWAPLVYVIREDEEDLYFSVIGDLNYWTTLDRDWFMNTNDLAFQALFELK